MSNASLHGRSRKLMAIFARVKQSAQAIQIRRNPFFHFLRVVSPPNLRASHPFAFCSRARPQSALRFAVASPSYTSGQSAQ
jgi:hypothetical protein